MFEVVRINSHENVWLFSYMQDGLSASYVVFLEYQVLKNADTLLSHVATGEDFDG